ncbi:MAG: hydroxymethylbilane synthase [Alphaproteobacteria bacterium]
MTVKLRIATRGSPLALAQAHEVRDRLAAAHAALAEPGAIDINVIRTTGDRMQSGPLSDIGGKGLFTKEIEEALLDGRADIAVHSMKDVPTWLPDGLVIGCLLPREDPRDAFISNRAATPAALPEGAVVGTASLRRRAILLHRRPDLRVVNFRGNVETRLDKLAAGEVDATLLATAGLNRLGKADRITTILEVDDMLPAVCQGAVGIELRHDDQSMHQWLAPLNDDITAARVSAERALLAALDGSCRTPIAALAEIAGDRLSLRGLIVRPDGSELIEAERTGAVTDAARLGSDAGEELRRNGGEGFFSDQA